MERRKVVTGKCRPFVQNENIKRQSLDKNYVKVILFNPATVEEHIYETATVCFRDEEDIRTLDTISIDRPIKGCCFGTETLSYIFMEKFWYNTPFDQIVRKLKALGFKRSKSTLGDNVHRVIEYMRAKIKEWWDRAMLPRTTG